MIIRQSDLFECGTYIYAHCISADAAMGAGIALQFRNKYSLIEKYIQQKSPKVGDAIRYVDGSGDIIYNLVTKSRYFNKPTYKTITDALKSLKQQMIKNNDRKIAMPCIGCGLDKLKWVQVKKIIEETFKGEDIEIIICQLKHK